MNTRAKFLSAFLIGAAILAISARPQFNPAPYYAPEKSITVQGINTVYLDSGSGQALLLIHGFSGNAYNWIEVFGPLAKDFRVIVVDLPGYGKSGCPAKNQKATMIWYADFLAEFMDKIGAPQAVVVGNSMGGSIAAFLAVRHPEKVTKLVLEDAAGLKGGKLELLKNLGTITAPAALIPVLHVVFPVTEESQAKAPPSERKRVELAELRYASDLRLCSSIAMRQSAISLGTDYTEPVLNQIKAPTLIIWGSNDDLLPVATAEQFHQKIPGSQVQIIEGGVHTPMQWKPEDFVKVLKDFAANNPK